MNIIKFMYSLFIAAQLLYLGTAEAIRIKNFATFLLNTSKKIRVKS